MVMEIMTIVLPTQFCMLWKRGQNQASLMYTEQQWKWYFERYYPLSEKKSADQLILSDV